MKTIVFSPHPDDETFACGGTIASKTASGEEVIVVIMTDGRNSHKMMGIEDDPSPSELTEIRKRECELASSILGVKKENLLFLGFEDIYLYESREAARGQVSHILTEHNPSEVFIPARNEFHPDHISTNLIVAAAIKELGINPRVYEYSIITTTEPRAAMGFLEIDVSGTLDRKKEAIRAYKSQINIFSPKQKRPIVSPYQLFAFMRDKECFLRVL
ncbi:MAG: PIG-L family deacetylase [Candidatus Methanoperedens sp.]|nr:PIG-L family deacetylase [Candidatus Methanoperedens sp.]